MNTLIILVHGFNVKDGGARTVDKLAPYLRGAGYEVDTDQADYGWFSLWAVRFRKHGAVRRIAEAIRSGLVAGQEVVIVSHSNGSNFTNKALKLLATTGHVLDRAQEVRMSPALNRSTGTYARRCTVFHSRTDIWPWLSQFLLWSPWGSQGTLGHNIKAEKYPGEIRSWDFTDVTKGHSDYYLDENAEFNAGEVIEAIQ